MPTILVNLIQSTGTKGGIEAYIQELYSSISKIKTDFHFVGLASTELYSSQSFEWFPGEVINSGISGENRIHWAFGELFTVSRVAKKIQADVIHCPAMFGPLRSHVPVVITVHDLSYFTHPKLMKNKVFTPFVKIMEKVAAKNADRLIAISRSTAELIPSFLGVSESKVVTILSAGRQLNFSPQKSDRSNSFYLAMGQRSPYKSLETAIKAWHLMPENKRPKLIITGSHGDDPLKKLVKQLHLENSVQLLSWVSDFEIDELLSTCSGLIETTRAAGFGMPAIEAMSIGTPVILSDIAVFREIAGPHAIYFDPGNPSDLAEKIMSFDLDVEKSKELQRNGPVWASQYNWDTTARKTLDVFGDVLSQK